jgi:surface protein
MDLREYYNLPEGTNVTLSFIPSFFDTVDRYPYPCPSSMECAFTNYKGASIPELDTSKVTNMKEMFNYCQKLTSLDASNWDTSNVTDMSNMFNFCNNLTSLDLSNWDTSNVTKMSNMFAYCSNLTSLDLSNWDTSNVTDMNSMFNSCSKLTSLSSIRADSLSIASYQSPFGSSNLTNLVDFGGFINLKSSWDGIYCLDRLTALSHQSLVNILNGLYDFTGNGETPTSSQGKIKFGSTHLANLSDEEKAIATNKGWVLS